MNATEWPPRPYDAETCRRRLKFLQHHFADHPELPKIEPGVRGAIIGCLNGVFYGESDKDRGDAKRHVVLGWLFGDPDKPLKPMSTKTLTEGQWYAIYKWLNLTRVVSETNKSLWLPGPEFTTEALHVLNAALRQAQKEEQQMLLLAGMENANG